MLRRNCENTHISKLLLAARQTPDLCMDIYINMVTSPTPTTNRIPLSLSVSAPSASLLKLERRIRNRRRRRWKIRGTLRVWFSPLLRIIMYIAKCALFSHFPTMVCCVRCILMYVYMLLCQCILHIKQNLSLREQHTTTQPPTHTRTHTGKKHIIIWISDYYRCV